MAIAADQRGVPVAGVARQLDRAAGDPRQPADEKLRVPDPFRIGGARHPVRAGKTGPVQGANLQPPERRQHRPLDPRPRDSRQHRRRFHNAADEGPNRRPFEQPKQGAGDGREQRGVLMGVDDGRRPADPCHEALVLGGEFALHVRGANAPGGHAFQEAAQRPHTAVGTDQAGHGVRLGNRRILGQARVPAQFHRRPGLAPGGQRFRGVGRIDHQHRPGDDAAGSQLEDAAQRFRADAVVVGENDEKAGRIHALLVSPTATLPIRPAISTHPPADVKANTSGAAAAAPRRR